MLLQANPHIAQAFFSLDEHPAASLPFTRCLQDGFPCLPYRERRRELRSVLNWGQRRLLLLELEFLSSFAPDYLLSMRERQLQPCVLYAGAAPGSHLQYLCSLFPQLHFVLLDPLPVRVRPAENVELRQEALTDGLALELSARCPLFICDARSASVFSASVSAVDAAIASDLSAQMRWHELLTPHRALLKFRLPWTAGSTPYLDGSLLLPVWGSQTTTECRLVPSVPTQYRDWQHAQLEQQMFHFNTRHRVQLYDEQQAAPSPSPPQHRDRSLSGLDRCYDCTAELLILRHFLLAFPEQQQRVRQRIALQQQPTAAAPSTAAAAAPEPRLCPPAAAASAGLVGVSPVCALSAAVQEQQAAIDSVIPLAIRALDIAEDGHGDGGGRAQQRAGEEAAERQRGASGCCCLECQCVWLSEEISAELCEGRTLLTAPLLPAAQGTANIRAKRTQRQLSRQRQRQSGSAARQHKC